MPICGEDVLCTRTADRFAAAPIRRPRQRHKREQALALYCGDFLTGFHPDGAHPLRCRALAERERLRFSVLESLEQVARQCVQNWESCRRAAGDGTPARRGSTQRNCPWPPDAAVGGEPGKVGGPGHFEACRQIPLAELGVEPNDALQTLRAQIRGPCTGAAVRASAFTPPPLRTAYNLPEPATPLIGRQRTLTAIQARLRNPAIRLVTLAGEGGGVGKVRRWRWPQGNRWLVRGRTASGLSLLPASWQTRLPVFPSGWQRPLPPPWGSPFSEAAKMPIRSLNCTTICASSCRDSGQLRTSHCRCALCRRVVAAGAARPPADHQRAKRCTRRLSQC